MKVALTGYGRMGQEIEGLAEELGHTVTAVFDGNQPLQAHSDVGNAEVVIDFSTASAVWENLEISAGLGLPVVEGTTGWLDEPSRLENISDLTVVYSPNFSIGVYQFRRIARFAARLLGQIGGYDCYLHEWHHQGKADSPSGTAKALAGALLAELPDKDRVLAETCHRKIEPGELHVTSTRSGRIPGTHEVGFDASTDQIVLRHQAHGRQAFARGALLAAEWIVGRGGIFTMDDFMNSAVSEEPERQEGI